MKRNWLRIALVLAVTAAVLLWSGIGLYSSGSAVADLKAELESIYGPEYTGKAVEDGTEDMVFEVEPKSWMLTNWNLRSLLGLDYQYECRVVVTSHTADAEASVRTVTYQAVDPMGTAAMGERAHLIPESRVEAVEIMAVTVVEGR